MRVLSVVDGSLKVDVAAGHNSVRTSFKAEGGTVQNLEKPAAFTAAPWPANWTARQLVPDIEIQSIGLALPRSVIARAVIGNAAHAAVHRLLRKPGSTNRTQPTVQNELRCVRLYPRRADGQIVPQADPLAEILSRVMDLMRSRRSRGD